MVDLDPMDMQVEPLFVPEDDVVFLLQTRRNPTVGQVIGFDLASIANSNFDAAHPTRFTIHGWLGDVPSQVNIGVAGAYHDRGEYNVRISRHSKTNLIVEGI